MTLVWSTRLFRFTRRNYHIVRQATANEVNAVLLRRTLASEATSGQGPKGRRFKWGSISTEWKIIGTIGVGILSWYINAKQDRLHSRKQLQMEMVTRQLKELYGPLYGNRIVVETSYRAVMKEFGGLKNYLRQAEQTKDADMIRRWRSYVLSVLHPLDKEAMDLLCRNAHLIAEKEFPEEFDRFLTHMSKMQFIMEQWKNESGSLETTKEITADDFLEQTNSSGVGGSRSMINHLRGKCKQLRMRQQAYVEDISVDNLTLGMLQKLFK